MTGCLQNTCSRGFMFVVRIQGGLGNQFFQYNFALYLKEKYPQVKLYINTSSFKIDSIHGGFMIEKPALSFYNSPKIKFFTVINDENFSEDIDPKKNIYFDGYWQKLSFFDKKRFDFFDILKNDIPQKDKEYIELINSCQDSVSIHVRCGDYNNHFLLGNIATISYFNNAVKYYNSKLKNPVFFVFSDDIEWVKKNINFDNAQINFVYGNEAPNLNKWDLYLMSLCKHNIMSNSSFSWWGHYFGGSRSRSAVTPPYWVNEPCPSFENSHSSLMDLEEMTPISNIPEHIEKLHPLFSVIITAYNQEICINRTINSVLNQGFENFEIILVDDASSDSTLQIVSDIASKDKRIKIVRHNKNSSSFVARKSGAQAARGQYILFLDGDDYLYTGALSALEKLVNEEDFDVAEFSYITRPENKVYKPDSRALEFSRLQYFTKENAQVTVWNKLYKASLVKSAVNDMPDSYINTGDDSAQSLIFAFYTKKYIQRDLILVNYMHGTGVSTRKNTVESIARNMESISTSILVITNFLNQNIPDSSQDLLNAVSCRFIDWLLHSLSLMDREARMKSFNKLQTVFPLIFAQKNAEIKYNKLLSKYSFKENIKALLPKRIFRIIKKILKG